MNGIAIDQHVAKLAASAIAPAIYLAVGSLVTLAAAVSRGGEITEARRAQ